MRKPFHLLKNGRESRKLVSKHWADGFQDMENESVCTIPSGKNRTTFSDVLLLSEIFLWNHENLNKRGDTVNKQVCWSNRLAKLSAM